MDKSEYEYGRPFSPNSLSTIAELRQAATHIGGCITSYMRENCLTSMPYVEAVTTVSEQFYLSDGEAARALQAIQEMGILESSFSDPNIHIAAAQ